MSRRLIAALVFLASIPAMAAGRVECGSLKSKFMPGPVGYCALLPPSYDSQPSKKFPVLYFLHGLNGDQSFLVTSGGWSMIEDAQEKQRLQEFVTITPQADNSFYINSKDGRERYEDFFIHDFVPEMEKHFRLLGTRGARAIAGVSMGGYGALRFAFKYPQMFSSVAALMPALLEQLPRGSSNAGLNSYLGNAFGRPLDEAFWKQNTPFVFARTAGLRGLAIYMECGSEDDFGFDAGTRQMDKLLLARHVAHQAGIAPGRHNWQFVAQHLEDALKVVSNSFDGHAGTPKSPKSAKNR